VFDCAGIMPGLLDGMDALCINGTYINVAGWEKEVSDIRTGGGWLLNGEQQCVVPMQYWMLKEIIFRASMSYTEVDFEQTVQEYGAGKVYSLIPIPSCL
jgi:threonine dehydrogenase-like Zn-dependent dehydrogenase